MSMWRVAGAAAASALQGELRAQLVRRAGGALASAAYQTQARRRPLGGTSSATAADVRLGVAMVGAAALTMTLELKRESGVAHARAAIEGDRLLGSQPRSAAGPPRRWQLFDEIGAGAFGTVRIGMHEESGEVAAVKIVEPVRNNYASLEREIAALKLVKALGGHRSIIDLKDVYVDGKKVFLVTELARGGELFDSIVAGGALGETRASAIVHEVASALAFMHRHGLVHKDIKPENILFTSRDDGKSKRGTSLVKLADFGSAGPASTNNTRLDDIGTSAYLPPELLTSGVCTTGCDMWALGCVLYIMLSGSHPFDLDGTAPDAVVERRIKQDVVSFDGPAWAAVSPDAKDLVAKLLDKNPAMRLTADQVLRHPWVAAQAEGSSSAVSLSATMVAASMVEANA